VVVLVTLDATLITGTAGAATTLMVFERAALVVAPLVSAQVITIEPAGPAVYVILFTPAEVTPAVPPALVMVPPEMVHA
jgi:hypothetical protein